VNSSGASKRDRLRQYIREDPAVHRLNRRSRRSCLGIRPHQKVRTAIACRIEAKGRAQEEGRLPQGRHDQGADLSGPTNPSRVFGDSFCSRREAREPPTRMAELVQSGGEEFKRKGTGVRTPVPTPVPLAHATSIVQPRVEGVCAGVAVRTVGPLVGPPSQLAPSSIQRLSV